MLRDGRSKLGEAQWRRFQLMAEFQTEVPHPLRDQLPALLSPGRVTAPTVRVLLTVLVCQYRLKGAAMQVQFDHIARGERSLRKTCEEEFVHDARARDPNGTFLFCGWMGGHDHAAPHPLGPHRHRLAVVEAAYDLTFRTLLGLIWGEVQTRLNERMIDYRVIFATSHEGEASQVRQRSSRAILSIEPEQGVLVWELVLREIPTKSRQALTQFLPIPPVTFVPKTAEPLKAMSLADDGARPYHLPAFASGVAGSTHLIQPAKRRGQIFSLGQGALAGGFSRAIHVKDHPGVSRSIHQSPR